MIKHIVMWRFEEKAEGEEKSVNIQKARQMLGSLLGEIPEIEFLQVGINENPSAAAYDLVLVTEFESWEALSWYQEHPAHKKVAAFIKSVVADRAVVDYA